MDAYATHLEPLIKAALETQGDILELGCGDYSTPLLALIAHSRGDKLVVCASDPVWASKYKDVADEIIIVEWDKFRIPEARTAWGLIFLDNEEHSPGRVEKLQGLRGHAKCIVMHDASQALSTAGLQGVIDSFTKYSMYDKHDPWTVTVW